MDEKWKLYLLPIQCHSIVGEMITKTILQWSQINKMQILHPFKLKLTQLICFGHLDFSLPATELI